jgi:hypothetical protein
MIAPIVTLRDWLRRITWYLFILMSFSVAGIVDLACYSKLKSLANANTDDLFLRLVAVGLAILAFWIWLGLCIATESYLTFRRELIQQALQK